jgi:hypothetical protein
LLHFALTFKSHILCDSRVIHIGSTLKPADENDPDYETPGYDTRRSHNAIANLMGFSDMVAIMEIIIEKIL